MDYSPISNSEKGLFIRTKLNAVLSALILGSEGINNVWGTLRALQSSASGLETTVQQNFNTLMQFIDNAGNYTDQQINELRNYIDTVSSGAGGLGGFIDSLNFSPDGLDPTTPCTLFTILTGTFVNMKDSNNNAITISGSNKFSIFYRAANATYWTVRSLEITPTLDSAVALALSILQGTHSLQQLTKGGNKVAPITTTLAVVDADRNAVLKAILDQYDSMLIDSDLVFSSTKSYAVGDLCIYERELYRFTTAHSGLWRADDAVKTSIVVELVRNISGGGSPSSAIFATSQAVSDVSIFGPDVNFGEYSDAQKALMIPNARYIENIRGVIYLDSMGVEFDGTTVAPITNGLVYDDSASSLVKYTGGVPTYISCNVDFLYCNKITGFFYRFITGSYTMHRIGGLPLVDNVASDDTDKALTAKQGKALKALIDALVLDSFTSTSTTKALSAKKGKELKDLVDTISTTLSGLVLDVLTSDDATKALSAKQGKALNQKFLSALSHNATLDTATALKLYYTKNGTQSQISLPGASDTKAGVLTAEMYGKLSFLWEALVESKGSFITIPESGSTIRVTGNTSGPTVFNVKVRGFNWEENLNCIVVGTNFLMIDGATITAEEVNEGFTIIAAYNYQNTGGAGAVAPTTTKTGALYVRNSSNNVIAEFVLSAEFGNNWSDIQPMT